MNRAPRRQPHHLRSPRPTSPSSEGDLPRQARANPIGSRGNCARTPSVLFVVRDRWWRSRFGVAGVGSVALAFGVVGVGEVACHPACSWLAPASVFGQAGVIYCATVGRGFVANAVQKAGCLDMRHNDSAARCPLGNTLRMMVSPPRTTPSPAMRSPIRQTCAARPPGASRL